MVNVRPDMRVVREEIFGPVLVAQRFDDLDEVVKAANDTPYGLGASIWTNNLSAAHRLVPRIKAGTVWVNCHNMVDPNMPFGGFKQSGFGREHGRVAIEHVHRGQIGLHDGVKRCSRPTPRSSRPHAAAHLRQEICQLRGPRPKGSSIL